MADEPKLFLWRGLEWFACPACEYDNDSREAVVEHMAVHAPPPEPVAVEANEPPTEPVPVKEEPRANNRNHQAGRATRVPDRVE